MAKVGEREVDDSNLSREIVYDFETGERNIVTRLMGKEWAEHGWTEGRNNLVAISAHITEAARIHLWRLIRRLPRGRVLYCDTDSLMIRENDLEAFRDVLAPKVLGHLSLEKRSPSVILRGLKDYRWNGQDVIKGIRPEAEQIGPSSYRQLMFPGLFTLLKDAQPGLFPIVTRTKTLKRTYDKGLCLTGN